MSKSNNPLTNYFKRKEIVDDVEEADKRTNESNGNGDVPDNHKRLKLDEFANSATSITNDSNIDSATTTSITTESSISISSSSTSNERDPAYGPAKAKDFLLIGPFQPTTKFPIVNNRRFRAEWYSMYEWLEYSLQLDRAFCFPCRLRNDSRYETAFILGGFGQWKNGTMRFNSHQAADFHKIAFERWKTAVHNLNNNTDVLKSLDQQHSKQASENRMYLKEIIRTVHFLARQGISFVVIEKTRNQVTKATS